jgi:phage shock protein E
MFRPLAAFAGSLIVLASIAGCSAPVEPIELSAGTIIIDVRTPGEFAGGHLNGANLLDLTGGQFAAALPTLDPAADNAAKVTQSAVVQ